MVLEQIRVHEETFDMGFLVLEGQKSELNPNMARRSKNENETSELVFFERNKTVTISKEGLSRPHRLNRWNKSSHSRSQIGSEVTGKPPQLIN
ncbi:hypothetical protein ACTXT7_016553 [Hymenolepis weldensis]